MNKFRILFALAYALTCVFLWWVSGYDFNERNLTAGVCASMTVTSFVVGLFNPFTGGK